MSEIVIELGAWQYNAGIAGLCNILEKNGIEINIHEDKLIFNSEEELKKALENFEEKYFNYLIEKYEKTLSWYKIVSYKEELQDIKNNFEMETLSYNSWKEIYRNEMSPKSATEYAKAWGEGGNGGEILIYDTN